MAVRNFNGTSDYFRLNIGGLAAMTYGTFGVLAKVTASAAAKTLFCLLDSTQTYLFTPMQASSTPESLDMDGPQLITSLPTGVWLLIVVRKNTGTATPRTSYYNYSTTTWTHVAASGTRANWTAPTAGFVNAATDNTVVEGFNGRLAASAGWSNSLPWSADSAGDAALVSAGLHTSAGNWLTANPSAFWLWNQASTATAVTDLSTTGTATQASLTGTTVVTGDDPPGFDFGLTSAPPPPTVVQAAGPWPCF
jgi:hypothetical protein